MDNKKVKKFNSELTPQIVLDGDLSKEKIEKIIDLGHEKNCLDYKEKFDFCSKNALKKSKIDLLCDIISMANGDGGYIIIGVNEDKSTGKFKMVGVVEDNIKKITQENIQSWLEKYAIKTVDFALKVNEINKKRIIAIFVNGSFLPVPFRVDGQYKESNGNDITKFRSGEIFVRHGSKSERANYADIINFMEKVRGDERKKGTPIIGRHRETISRLDAIIHLLGGTVTYTKELDLLHSSEEDIENKLIQILSQKNHYLIRRLIFKEFSSLNNFLKEQCKIKNYEKLIENLNRTYEKFLIRIIIIWIVALEYDAYELAEPFVERMFKLYIDLDRSSPNQFSPRINSIWFQSRIIYSVYCCGAIGIYLDKPKYVKLLLNRENSFRINRRKNTSCFRYILTMLARDGKLKNNSLCFNSLEFIKTSEYLLNYFNGEEELKDYLAQFDFLQCANTLVKQILGNGEIDNIEECYPSFGALYKKRIRPIVEKIIKTYNAGEWLPESSKSNIVEVINFLDSYANKQFGFYGPWDFGDWDSKIISDFLQPD